MAQKQKMFSNTTIDEITIEPTSLCNAACPMCSRNDGNSSFDPKKDQYNLDLELFKNEVPEEFLKSLKVINFSGKFGDAIMYPKLLELIQWIKSKSSANIMISTNGGAKSASWWRNLASILDSKDIVIFHIDGLEDTNHIYRIGVKWRTLMRNVRSFIDSGGTAQWNFIVCKHNQHQVLSAMALSKSLGFLNFRSKHSNRFDFDFNLKVIQDMRPKNQKAVINSVFGALKKFIKCEAAKKRMIYFSPDNRVFICSFLYLQEFQNSPKQKSYRLGELPFTDIVASFNSYDHQLSIICHWACGSDTEDGLVLTDTVFSSIDRIIQHKKI